MRLKVDVKEGRQPRRDGERSDKGMVGEGALTRVRLLFLAAFQYVYNGQVAPFLV